MMLTPLVYWAQRHEEIYLRVELTDAQVSETRPLPPTSLLAPSF